jgi:phenylpropionate dioxygenase-like ring-hydroxylating dioxygenase large terminal subunit
MKSAYGLAVPEVNSTLTRVDAGSPMGELFRRYWQPVCLSSELGDVPRKVKILCEDLLLFRSRDGEVGCLDPHCAHRGSSLEFGRIEQKGIRCCYHGWLYAPDGRVLEMPCEAAGACERMNIEQPSYPVREFGGLVFIYMGPPGREPELPPLDVFDTTKGDKELRGVRIWGDYAIGYVRDCNWLQHYENVVDPWHILILHQSISGDQFESAVMQGSSHIKFEPTPLGIRYKLTKTLPNGATLVRCSECMVPNIALIPNIREDGKAPIHEDRCSDVTWVVPIDNEHVMALSIVAWPLVDGTPREGWRPGTDTVSEVRPGSQTDRSYRERQLRPDDLEAQESQRPIAVHGLEHLGRSDAGVVRLRRLLGEQTERVAAGDDPINVFRDVSAFPSVVTNAWNTVTFGNEAL